jgi:3-dehydroquinate synthase
MSATEPDTRVKLHKPRGRLEWLEEPDGFSVCTTHRDAYEIVIRSAARHELDEYVERLTAEIGSGEIVLISDELVAGHWLEEALSSLERTRLRVSALTIARGERSKSIETLAGLWDRLLEIGVSRRAIIIAYGGGIICDLAGFLAATYMRGVPYINVPTSLLAQIDGAIGGKVAVDHPQGKNLLGSFYHPRLVLIDPEFLTTLEHRPLVAGLAEAVKVSLLASAPLFERISAWVGQGLPLGEPTAAESIITESVAIKLALLQQDPFELGDLDRLLNLGHEIAHSLEAVTSYERYLHGEAVAVGLAVTARLAAQEGVCAPAVSTTIVDLLRAADLPISVPPELVSAVWAHLDVIRNIRNGALRVVMPIDIGHCTIVHDISEPQYRDAAR